jgi:probable rRNA maturation factor
MIQFFFEDIDPVLIPPETIIWIENIILQEEKKVGKINYIFGTDEALLAVNNQYLQHDYYTDIITFDYVKGVKISADIFVSLPRILENANVHSKNFNSEFNRVLAHGILHLCGYKDKTAAEISEMRSKEDFYLKMI